MGDEKWKLKGEIESVGNVECMCEILTRYMREISQRIGGWGNIHVMQKKGM